MKNGIVAKLEHVYLDLVRILLIAGASIALVFVVLGVLGGMPLLTSILKSATSGEARPEPVRMAELEGRREVTIEQSSSADEVPDVRDDFLRAAAQNIVGYARSALNLELSEQVILKSLQDRRAEFPEEFYGDYSTSAKAFSEDMKQTSKQYDLDQLLDWHDRKFSENIQSAVANREGRLQEAAVEQAKALQALLMAGVALLAFLLIILCFILVKIERNLRLVNTREVEPEGKATLFEQAAEVPDRQPVQEPERV
jgi:hypothetical protein